MNLHVYEFISCSPTSLPPFLITDLSFLKLLLVLHSYTLIIIKMIKCTINYIASFFRIEDLLIIYVVYYAKLVMVICIRKGKSYIVML